MLYSVVLIEHPGTAQIGRSSHSGASGSTADHFGLQMINRHCLPSFLKGYCETQQPFFRTRLQQVRREMRRTSSRGVTIRSTPASVSSCRWQVDAGRRRDEVAIYHPMNRGFQSGNPCADCMGKAGSLAEMQPCPAASADAAIPLGLHPQVRFGGQPPQAALSPEMSARARPMGGLPPPALAGGE